MKFVPKNVCFDQIYFAFLPEVYLRPQSTDCCHNTAFCIFVSFLF